MVSVPYLISQRLIFFWWVELDLPLSCSLTPHTSIHTIASFGNSPCSSRPWYRALYQLLARFLWRCSGFLALFFSCGVSICPPYWPFISHYSSNFFMFYGDVGVWPSCVSSPILLNVAPESLWMGFLLPFYSARWEIYTLGSFFLLFFLIDWCSDRGTCIEFLSYRGSDRVLASNVCQIFTFSLYSPIS